MEIKAYDKLPKEAKDIRREVFIDEQGFKNECDDIDNKQIQITILISHQLNILETTDSKFSS